jgi:pimeloyl-ACP methyl ester carboxylesterase
VRLRDIGHGCLSMLGVLLHPLGRFCGPLFGHLRTPERLERGLVLVLPGIEGQSFINQSIAQGLADGGVEAAIEIYDWTTGIILLFLYHLRGWRRNVKQAERLARRIVEYRKSYPGRPIYLIGHSGGGALSVLTLERLPPGATITGAVLLNAALSPRYDLTAALPHVETMIWNFRSIFDLFFVGIGTVLAGTVDGRHTCCAGMIGFRVPADLDGGRRELYAQRVRDVPFRAAMMADFHFGGHMGPSNRVFVARNLAPLIKGASS